MKSEKFATAKAVVEQMKNGEWKPSWNGLCHDVLTIENGGVEIWIGLTGFDCKIYNLYEIKEINPFGIWKHWVWFEAQKIRRAEKIKQRGRDADSLRQAQAALQKRDLP